MKQVAGIVFISAATTLGSLWGYNHFNQNATYIYRQDSAKVPVNYAKFFDHEKSAGPADFVDAASAAIPATVHIKTKTTRTATNNLPKKN
ncbi:MAG TPA: serine protease, partial [Puia sp.]